MTCWPFPSMLRRPSECGTISSASGLDNGVNRAHIAAPARQTRHGIPSPTDRLTATRFTDIFHVTGPAAGTCRLVDTEGRYAERRCGLERRFGQSGGDRPGRSEDRGTDGNPGPRVRTFLHH